MPDKKLRLSMSLDKDLIDLLGSFHSCSESRKFGGSFFIIMVRMRLPSCHTFVGFIHLFSTSVYYLQTDTQTL